MNTKFARLNWFLSGIFALLISPSFGQGGNPDNPDPPRADPSFSDYKVGQQVLDTSSNTIEVNHYTEGELYQILPSADGVYRFYGSLTVNSGLDNTLMSLEGMPGKPAMEAPANSTSYNFEFTRSAYEFGDKNMQLTIRNKDTKKLLKAIPLSCIGDYGTNSGGSLPGAYPSRFPVSDNGYQQEEDKCYTCSYADAEEEIKSKPGKGSKCAAGQTTHEPTNDKRVNSMTSAGQGNNGRSPASLDHSTSDLSDPSSGSPSSLNPRTATDGQVTMSSGGTYPEQITTDSGTIKVTTATGGYDMAYYEKSDTTFTNPQTELCVRRVVSGSGANLVYKLRFIEKRFGTSIIECRYEQAIDAYKVSGVTRGDIWTLYEGAELASKAASEAQDSDFLRKTVTEVDDLENSEIITVSERAATSGLWVVVSKVKNFYGSQVNGGPITKSIIDFGGAARERTWDYNTISELNKYKAGLSSIFTEHTGAKVYYYYNSTTGFPTSTTSTYAGEITGRQHIFTYSGSGYDLKVEERISNQSVSSFYLVSSEDTTTKTVTMERSPAAGAAVGAAGALKTTVTRYKTSSGPESNLVKKIVNEDNTYMTYDYASSMVANPWMTTTTQVPQITITTKEYGSDDVVWSETETDYVCGIRKEVREYTHDLETYSAARVHLATTSYSNLDGLARPLTTTVSFPTSSSSANQVSSRVIGCCGLKQTTDHRGVVKVYHYDHLRRLETVEQGGLVRLMVYNGLEVQTGKAPADPALQDSHGHYTSRGANPGFLMSKYRKVNLLGNTTHSRVPSKQSVNGYETNTHLFTYYADVVRERIKRPDNQYYYYRNYFDGKFMRQNGTGSYWIIMSYGPSITGLTYPAGAVNATKEDFNNGRWNATFVNYLGQAIESTNAHGATSVSEYNSLGQLVKTTSADGVVNLYDYNNRGEQIKSALDLNGNGTIEDASDRVAWSESYYDLSGNRYGMVSQSSSATVENSSAEKITGFSWSSLDGLHSYQQPLDDPNLKSTSETSLNGSGNWVVTTTSATGAITTATFTTGYLVSKTSTGAGQTLSSLSYGYDDYRRVETVTDARTGLTKYTYAAAGNVLTATLERGAGTGDDIKTTYVYNNMGRLVKTIDPNGESTYRDYDLKGNLTAMWGENTYARAYEYNSSFQMTAMHTFKDDSVFNATTPPTLSSPNFAKTEWIYEATSGYLKEKKDADLKSVKYDYSVGGRLLTRTWARGLRTRYYYDSVGQLTNTHYFATVGDDNGNSDPSLNTGNDSNTKDLSYEYDRLGRLKTVRRDGAIHAEYDYDPGDLRISTEELYADMNGVGQTLRTKLITRTRDLKLRPSTVAVRDPLDPAYGSDDHAYAYTYDGAGRLETVRHDATLSSGSSPTGGKVLTYSYLNQAGGLIETIDGPGHTVTNDWMPYRSVLNDKENRGKQTGTPVLSKYDYSVNKIGQRETVTQTGYAFSASGTTSASLSLTWGYNSRGELVSEDHSDNTRDNAYQFDGIGNREKSKHDSITLPTAPDPSVDYVSNSVNEYATVPGGFATAHDDDGNLTSGPVPGDQQNHNTDGSNAEVPLNATSLVWDGENRLVSVVVGSVTVDYEYDYLGRQIYRDASNAAAYWTIYDGWNEIGVYFGTQTPTCTFTWGKDLSGSLQGAGGVGGLLVTKHAGTDVYPLYDGNGNVTQYIDGSGVFAARWEYDSFGRTTKVYNGNLFATWAMLHRFSTKVMDYTTGLHYYGHRWYNSYTGRWPSRDPIGERGGINLYGFVQNRPTWAVDVNGEFPWALAGGLIGAGLAVVNGGDIGDVANGFVTGFVTTATFGAGPIAAGIMGGVAGALVGELVDAIQGEDFDLDEVVEGGVVGGVAGILPQIGQNAQHIPQVSKEIAGLAFGVIVSAIDTIRDAWQEAFVDEADICLNSNVGAPAIGGPLPTIENFLLIQQLIKDLEKDPNNKAAIDAAKQIRKEWNQVQIRR